MRALKVVKVCVVLFVVLGSLAMMWTQRLGSELPPCDPLTMEP